MRFKALKQQNRINTETRVIDVCVLYIIEVSRQRKLSRECIQASRHYSMTHLGIGRIHPEGRYECEEHTRLNPSLMVNSALVPPARGVLIRFY